MSESNPQLTRFDHKIIAQWITPNSRVLDLGCGDGELLAHLIHKKNVKGTGIEISEEAIYKCIAKGLSISHGNIDSGLADYSTKRFDFVILNESLQEVRYPKMVILEALRVGKRVIVGIPNFCHWTARTQIFFEGRVPVTKELPHQWYDTPNLRFLSLKDFHQFCEKEGIKIEKQRNISIDKEVSIAPNLFARIGLFLLKKE